MSTIPLVINQGGYFSLPSFTQLKKGMRWGGENFEWWLVAALIIGIGISYMHDKQVTKMMVEAPQRNDFFFVDYFALDNSSNAKYRYLPLRVMEVKDQSLVFKVGNIAYTTKASPREHMMADKAMLKNFYRQKTMELTFEQLSVLYHSDVVYSAARPDNIYIDGWIVMHPREL